jgi:hypothetical protein
MEVPMPVFSTPRLSIHPWDPHLDDPDKRHVLKQAIRPMLSDAAMRYLPSTLALGSGPDPLEDWVVARQAAASVSVIQQQDITIGLLFLFLPPAAEEGSPIHLGYLLAEQVWGQGLGSELVAGLIAHLEPGPLCDLQAGVDINNHASARILKKSGFVRAPEFCADALDVYVRSVGSILSPAEAEI